MVNWMVATGNRAGTMANIMMKDVAFDSMEIFIRVSKTNKLEMMQSRARFCIEGVHPRVAERRKAHGLSVLQHRWRAGHRPILAAELQEICRLKAQRAARCEAALALPRGCLG